MNRFLQRMVFLLLLIVGVVGCGSSTGTATDDTAVPTTVADAVQATNVPSTEVAEPTAEAMATSLPPTEAPAPTDIPATASMVAPTETPEPAPPGAPSVAVGTPIRLKIPKIGLDAAIEPVGDDIQGRMDVPSRVEDVAWYTKRARPGEVGNAVISGHLDNYKQEPVVFWDLNKLEAGDDVYVVDENNTEWHFQVVNRAVYPDTAVPLDVVFGQSVVANLNLITCNGTWDTATENYNERLVVYTRLVQ